MMSYYYVKADLYGVPRGSVERFHISKAGPLLAEGKLEAFDEQKHKDRPGAADAKAHLKARRANEGDGKR